MGNEPRSDVADVALHARGGRLARHRAADLPPGPCLLPGDVHDRVHRGRRAGDGCRARPARCAHANVEDRAPALVVGVLRAHLPRHASPRADLLRVLRREPDARVHADPEHAPPGPLQPRRGCRRRDPRARSERGRVHAGDHPRRNRLDRPGADGSRQVARHALHPRDATGRAAPGGAGDRPSPWQRVQQHVEDDVPRLHDRRLRDVLGRRDPLFADLPAGRVLPRRRVLVPRAHGRMEHHPGVDRAAAGSQRTW